MRKIDYLILHCSDSEWGNVESIRRFHVQERQWSDIGYHFLVTNAYPSFEDLHMGRPSPDSDGQVYVGRELDAIGAHAHGWNDRSIGLCMVGRRGTFSGQQVKAALSTCKDLAYRFEVPFNNVIGHYETGAQKTCPDIDMDWFRHMLRRET